MTTSNRKVAVPLPHAQAPPGTRASIAPPRIRSDDLFGGAQEVVIRHNEREYRLRVTAQGKLILTA